MARSQVNRKRRELVGRSLEVKFYVLCHSIVSAKQKAARVWFDANGLKLLYSLCQAVHVGLAYALQDVDSIAERVCFY
ncbi:MAG: hypothetical protein B6D41_11800 [Chloroflexi bacterium UTCFX4]|nr:MAG: hypothetical protein B6D41_11800 [Chloroflexi bacterium UTCFX4]